MKTHTTNYFNTFIEVAEDTKAISSTIPPSKEKRTVADLQYELITKNPYKYTSDDILFQVFADRNDIIESDYKQAREEFYSKGQPCFRASPLAKTYGFGIHHNNEGKIALFGIESEEYHRFIEDTAVKKVKAMKSKK